MSRIREFFTFSLERKDIQWKNLIKTQQCRYIQKKCKKTRKSQADVSIGTCTVQFGKDNKDIIICPHRLLERRQIFTDCLHLLSLHQPGNELHIVPEFAIQGGFVDYVLVSTDANRNVKDFVGIELQTMDTTGSIWPEHEQTMLELGVKKKVQKSTTSFGMNWKMTAKTILMQLLHKIDTFEHVKKHFVLVVQNYLLDYIMREFSSGHIIGVRAEDSMHFHSYKLVNKNDNFKLRLDTRYSTDSIGIARLLGINTPQQLEFDELAIALQKKISDDTLFQIPSC